MRSLGEELYFLGRLCSLGNNALAVKEALTAYLKTSHPTSAKQAMLLLAEAYTRLAALTQAVDVSKVIVSRFGFDQDIDNVITEVTDAAAGKNETLPLAIELSEVRQPYLVDIFQNNNSFSSADGTLGNPLSALFEQGLGLCGLYRDIGNVARTLACLNDFNRIASERNLNGIHEATAIANALTRFKLVGTHTPLKRLPAKELRAGGGFTNVMLTFQSKKTLLFFFSMASPSSEISLSKLKSMTISPGSRQMRIYALTSFEANRGGDNSVDQTVINGIRALEKRFPPGIHVLVVPQKILNLFGIDEYPTIVLVWNDGTIRFDGQFRDSPGIIGSLNRAFLPLKSE